MSGSSRQAGTPLSALPGTQTPCKSDRLAAACGAVRDGCRGQRAVPAPRDSQRECPAQSGEGISEIKRNIGCILYPNPFIDKFNIVAKESGQFEIILWDILSRKLIQQTFTESATLNTEQLANGIYIFEVRNKNETILTGKVIKQ